MADLNFYVDILVPGKEPGQDAVQALFLDRSNVWRIYKHEVEANAYGFRVNVDPTLRYHIKADTLSLRLASPNDDWTPVLTQIPLRNMLGAVWAKKSGQADNTLLEELSQHVRELRTEVEQIANAVWTSSKRTVTATPSDNAIVAIRADVAAIGQRVRGIESYMRNGRVAEQLDALEGKVAALPAGVWAYNDRRLTVDDLLSHIADVRQAVDGVAEDVWGVPRRSLTVDPSWALLEIIAENVQKTPKNTLRDEDVPVLAAAVARRLLTLDVRTLDDQAAAASVITAVLHQLGYMQDGKILRDDGTPLWETPKKEKPKPVVWK